jgi:hypothetical protein
MYLMHLKAQSEVVLMSPEYAVHTVQVFEKDLKAVWKLLAERNPEAGGNASIPEAATSAVAMVGAPEASAKVTVNAEAELEWTEKQLADFYAMCQPVQRAIVVCVAEAGIKEMPVPYDEFHAAAAGASPIDGFTNKHLAGNLAWITKYASKVGHEEAPFEGFMKGGVWYIQMEPARAKTILRLREKFGN